MWRSKLTKLEVGRALYHQTLRKSRESWGCTLKITMYIFLKECTKLEYLKEMGRFLDIYDLWKLNTDHKRNFKRPIIPSEIETVTKILPIEKKSPGTGGFSIEFYQTIEELMPLVFKIFFIIETKQALPNYFYETTLTLLPKPHKDSRKEMANQYSLWT